jgi:hypothetical protein
MRLTFKNYGPAEATASFFENIVSVDGEIILKGPVKLGGPIAPQGRKVIDWLIGGTDFDALKRSQARIYVRYYGPYYQSKTKSYELCERWQYDLRESTFTVIGYCDGASGFSKVP